MDRNLLYLAAWVSLLIPACIDDNDTTTATSQAVTSRADTIVSPGLARAIAETYKSPRMRHVRTSSMTFDTSQRVAMYGFTFEEGGFVVVGGDFELAPILAYGDTGTIDLAAPNDGLAIWADAMRVTIEAVRGRGPGDTGDRAASIAQDRDKRDAWLPLLDNLASRSDIDPAEVVRARSIAGPDICYDCQPPPPACHVVRIDAWGPLMSSHWGQGCEYNYEVPSDPNATADYCNNMPAGCAPVAVAQIMRHHRHDGPYASYDFNMPDGYVSTNFIHRAELIRDLGFIAGTNYQNGGSTTNTASMLLTIQLFGYQTSNGGYWIPHNIVAPEVAANRPVLVNGWTTAGKGHTWVADGAWGQVLGPPGCKAVGSQLIRYIAYNWGFDDNTNGWYYEGDYRGYSVNRDYVTATPVGPN